ncbi:MAG: hypothetical protein M5U12_14010 [Verrucomicrobia bacterium]|nr:hypothetical protein [Verrucomicrobiota bacterium]
MGLDVGPLPRTACDQEQAVVRRDQIPGVQIDGEHPQQRVGVEVELGDVARLVEPVHIVGMRQHRGVQPAAVRPHC